MKAVSLGMAIAIGCTSCGSGEAGRPGAPPLRENALLVIEITGLAPDASLPEALSTGMEDLAYGRLSSTGYPSDTLRLADAAARDAYSKDYLCLLVDVATPPGDGMEGSRSNMLLTTAAGGLNVVPEELSREIDRSRWGGWRERQLVVAELMDKYQPDVIVMKLEADSAEQVPSLLDLWTGYGEGGLDLVMYSPSRPAEQYRGWTVLHGPGFLGGRMDGLTARGTLATLRAVMDVPDTIRAPEGTAALGHLAPEGSL